MEAVKKLSAKNEDSIHYGMELVQDKIQQVLLLLENLDLKFELQMKTLRTTLRLLISTFESSTTNETLLINSRLQNISTEKGIEQYIRRVHGDLASLNSIIQRWLAHSLQGTPLDSNTQHSTRRKAQ